MSDMDFAQTYRIAWSARDKLDCIKEEDLRLRVGLANLLDRIENMLLEAAQEDQTVFDSSLERMSGSDQTFQQSQYENVEYEHEEDLRHGELSDLCWPTSKVDDERSYFVMSREIEDDEDDEDERELNKEEQAHAQAREEEEERDDEDEDEDEEEYESLASSMLEHNLPELVSDPSDSDYEASPVLPRTPENGYMSPYNSKGADDKTAATLVLATQTLASTLALSELDSIHKPALPTMPNANPSSAGLRIPAVV